jgi:superfamily II DNA or RNA helicase
MLILPNPTQVRLFGYESRRQELEQCLAYVDKKVDFEIRKLKQGGWFVRKYGDAAFQERLKNLKDRRSKTLLFEDEQGLWTYSGLAHRIAYLFDDEVRQDFQRPKAKLIPWSQTPSKVPRYYQTIAEEKLLEVSHGGVEIGTGLGKSLCLVRLCKALGLKTVVMCPSVNIAEQLYDELVLHFGRRYVGAFFDGKKQAEKLFVVGVAQSLTKVREGSPAWEQLSKAEVFIADESHMCPAKTLSEVCFGLCARASYRFFFSGTQLRNDGLDLLLDAITGPIVFKMTVQEGVDQGFLAKPIFRMLRLKSTVAYDSPDANNLTRAHVYYNPQVNAAAADVVNRAVGLMNRPTLILVEELEQFSHLLPHLRYEARFAHGGVNGSNKDLVPSKYHDSDPKALVEAFNRGEFPVLAGTSCIAMGTDIQAVQCVVYLRGGKSEIEVKQSVGRCTRLFPGKSDCLFIDFAIDNVRTLANHAEARRSVYSDIYPSYQDVKL